MSSTCLKGPDEAFSFLPEKVEIRRAVASDLPEMESLIRSVFIPESATYLCRSVENGVNAGWPVYVAILGESVVALISCRDDGVTVSLDLIAVLPHLQNRGLGRHLLLWLIGNSTAEGRRFIRLSCCAGEHSQHLYRSLRFKDVDRLPEAYANGDDALIMLLTLG